MCNKFFWVQVILIIGFAAELSPGAVSYLNNGVITIGVDDSKGGTITFLKDNSDGRDIVNDYDLGREIQQSYYSGPDDYDPYGNQHPSYDPWPWNPVAAGDVYNNASTVEKLTNDGNTIYVRSVPKQWALNNVDTECTFEKWITLEDNVVIMRCRLNDNRADTTFYSARHQELPAVYTNSDFQNLYSYTGNNPFTGDSVSYIPNPSGDAPPWAHFKITENWAALVDSSNWGLGIYTPGVYSCNGGYHDSWYNPADTGHMAPVRSEHIDHNIIYEFECYLIVDDLTGIRNWVYQHRPNPLPDYNFRNDRRGWYHTTTDDTGFPWPGYWRVNLDTSDPYVTGPLDHWDAADVPTIYVRARYSTAGSSSALIFFSIASSPGFVGGRSASFTVIRDGQYHTYAVNMSSHIDYSGMIQQIRFDPVPNGSVGQYVDIDYISAYPIPGDYDRDEDIDMVDFNTLAGNWLKKRPPEFIGDLTGDHIIDFYDVSVFLENWLQGTGP